MNCRNAFTLIELVIATALAALLMIGVLAVLTGITRDRQRLSASESSPGATRNTIAEIIRRDLSGSTQFSVLADGSVQLWSLQAIDGKTLQPIDRPSLIIYGISDKDGLGLLMRDQELQDEAVRPPALRSLLVCHVREFDIERLPDPDDPATKPNVPANNSTQNRTIPHRVKLKIAFSDSSDTIDQVLCLR